MKINAAQFQVLSRVREMENKGTPIKMLGGIPSWPSCHAVQRKKLIYLDTSGYHLTKLGVIAYDLWPTELPDTI